MVTVKILPRSSGPAKPVQALIALGVSLRLIGLELVLRHTIYHEWRVLSFYRSCKALRDTLRPYPVDEGCEFLEGACVMFVSKLNILWCPLIFQL